MTREHLFTFDANGQISNGRSTVWIVDDIVVLPVGGKSFLFFLRFATAARKLWSPLNVCECWKLANEKERKSWGESKESQNNCVAEKKTVSSSTFGHIKNSRRKFGATLSTEVEYFSKKTFRYDSWKKRRNFSLKSNTTFSLFIFILSTVDEFIRCDVKEFLYFFFYTSWMPSRQQLPSFSSFSTEQTFLLTIFESKNLSFRMANLSF